MKRRLYTHLLWVVVVSVVLVFPCSAPAYSEKEPLTLKCGIATPPDDVYSRTIKRLGDHVEKGTNGRVKFQYFYSESLIKKPQFVDAVAKGIADISVGPISFVTGKMPELSILEIYGAYKLNQFPEVLKAVEPALLDYFKTKGIHLPMYHYPGPAIFCHRTKLLKAPGDWKGEKMRLGGRWQSTLAKNWGASPVFMPPSELYVALQKGVIEGFMLVWDVAYGLKLFEVAPFVIDTDFSLNLELITMNLGKWNSLTPADQKVFSEAGREVTGWGYQEILKKEQRIQKELASKGVKIHRLTAEEKAPYLRDSYKLWPEVRGMSGPVGNKLADVLEGYREK